MKTQRVTIGIENLSSAVECQRIVGALEAASGVLYAYASPLTEMAYVEYDPAQRTAGQLREIVARLGFQTETPELR